MDPAAAQRPPRSAAESARRALTVARNTLLALAGLVGLVSRGMTSPIVLGPFPVDSPSVVAALVGGATAPATVSAFACPRRLTSGPRRGRPAPGRWAVVALVLLTWAVLGLVWFVDLASSGVHVLEPSSALGCRIVVRETSFTWLGSGEVYVLPPGHLVADHVSGYTADDGLQPVARGLYRLSWQGTRALLSVSGTPYDPVWPTEHVADCG